MREGRKGAEDLSLDQDDCDLDVDKQYIRATSGYTSQSSLGKRLIRSLSTRRHTTEPARTAPPTCETLHLDRRGLLGPHATSSPATHIHCREPWQSCACAQISSKTLANIVDSVTSLVLPFAHAICPRNHYLHRLAVIFLAFGPLFIILTISYEGLFYFAIAVTLVSWVRLEHRIHQRAGGHGSTITSTSLDQATTKGASSSLGNTKNATANGHASITNELDKTLDVTTPLAPAADAAQQRELAIKTGDYRSLTLSDARICLFFLFLLQSAFYSTGNIASISSFSLDAVYRLLPVFDPFSQGALLLLKLLAPFALVSANLGILTKRLRLRGGSLFAVVMAIGDYLTLRFFWEVRDEGSWLEIGESISMFVIASVLCVFVAGLEALSEIFVMGVEFRDDDVSPPQQAEGAKERSANGRPPRNGKLLGQST